jgi:hypothetical protein
MIRKSLIFALTLALAIPSAAAVPACKTNPTLTPASAAKAEKDLVLLVRDASAAMLAAYKAGDVSATIADPYFDAVDATVLPLARRAKAAIVAWQLAADGPGKIASAEQLKALLTELETEARAVFGRSLPAGVAQKIGNIAGAVYDAIASIRAQITAARAPAAEGGNR